MGYLGGFLVTLAQVGRRNKLTLEYSGGRENKKGKPQKDEKARPPCFEPLRRRYGKVHRL